MKAVKNNETQKRKLVLRESKKRKVDWWLFGACFMCVLMRATLSWKLGHARSSIGKPSLVALNHF